MIVFGIILLFLEILFSVLAVIQAKRRGGWIVLAVAIAIMSLHHIFLM